MKKNTAYVLIYLLVILITSIFTFTSCKKKDIKPIELTIHINDSTCITKKIHVLEGTYELLNDSSITIQIYYIRSQCNDLNISHYGITNLQTAYKSINYTNVDPTDYILIANESNSAFERGFVQIVPAKNKNEYLFSLAMKDQSYTLGIKKIK